MGGTVNAIHGLARRPPGGTSRRPDPVARSRRQPDDAHYAHYARLALDVPSSLPVKKRSR